MAGAGGAQAELADEGESEDVGVAVQPMLHEEQGVVRAGADDLVERTHARPNVAHELQGSNSDSEEIRSSHGLGQRMPPICITSSAARAAEHVPQAADTPQYHLEAGACEKQGSA